MKEWSIEVVPSTLNKTHWIMRSDNREIFVIETKTGRYYVGDRASAMRHIKGGFITAQLVALKELEVIE